MTIGQSSGSQSHDNVPNSNQQQQTSMYQWPYYTSQNSTQAPWQQFPLPQQSHVFWPQLFGANIPPIFQTFNANGFQANPNVPEATSSITQHLVPNMSYHVGYTFPGSLGMYVIVDFHTTCGYLRIFALYFDTYFTKILWN
jgi:hypothetical protein